MSEIKITDLEKSFGRQPVLQRVDLRIPDRAIAAVLGASGCGKTTLLRILAGFETADQGSVEIAGELVDDGRRHVPPESRRLGYVPQEGSLFPHLSVADNVGFGIPRRQPGRAETIARVLELVGLAGYQRRRPNQLSGGEQQRIALARALAPNPRVILLDEPFAALDPGTRTAMRIEIATLLRSLGTTAILVTHDQEEALSVADIVAVIAGGQIAQADRPETLYNHPATSEVARFLGDANLLTARIRNGISHSALGRIPLRSNTPDSEGATILVRPEQIQIDPLPPDATRTQPPTARVTRTVFLGHDTLVTLTLEHRSPPITIETRTNSPTAQPGELVGLRVIGPVVPIKTG